MPTWEYGLKTKDLAEEEMIKRFEKALTSPCCSQWRGRKRGAGLKKSCSLFCSEKAAGKISRRLSVAAPYPAPCGDPAAPAARSCKRSFGYSRLPLRVLCEPAAVLLFSVS